MGTNTLVTKNINDTNDENDLNQFNQALSGEFSPRNNAGVVSNISGSLGMEQLRFLKASIAKGYWGPGDIKAHHSYNGVASISNGWYPCDGSIVNESNYNDIHGAGAWDTFIGTSVFDGKYTPNLNGKYISGTTATTEDGSGAISTVGNSSSQIDLTHTHTGIEHNHNWYVPGIGSGASAIVGTSVSGNEGTFNSSGSSINIPVSGTGPLNAYCYTSNSNPSTTSSGSATQDIRPDSIEVTFYMRII